MITREEAVFEIREAATAWADEARRGEQGGQFHSITDAYLQDATSLRTLADLFEEGCDARAYMQAWKLDTIVRECLSIDVWDFIDAKGP